MRLESSRMIGRGLFILTALFNCVLSLPVTPSQLENEDVQVMKCIVEVLADVLSRPHPAPVSQECLVTLRTDDRLVSILRHHNFLKELQEIAVKGGQERAQLQGDAAATTQSPQTTSDAADRSMLEALGGPGERSILSQKRGTGLGAAEEEKDDSPEDGESQEDNNITEEVQVKREKDESPGSHISESEDEWSEGKDEKREEEEEEEEEEEGSDLKSQEKSEEGSMAKEKKGARSDEKTDTHRNKSKEKKSDDEEREEKEKRSMFFSHKEERKHQDGEQTKRGGLERGGLERGRQWTKRAKAVSMRKKAAEKELTSEQEVPHHSKEVSEEVEEKKKRNTQRSLEEKELQMIARSGPVGGRGLEEEGSASRKSEDPEIESLAAIESELENVAQKLHEMRRG